MYAYGHLALPHPEAQRTLAKIFKIAIEDKICAYSKMHSKSRILQLKKVIWQP